MIKIYTLFCISIFAVNSFSQTLHNNHDHLTLLTDNVFHLSEVMLHDVTNPPAASRFYAYALLAAYETALQENTQLTDINKRLKVNPNIKAPAISKNHDRIFCAIYSMLETGRQLMPSGYLLTKYQKELVNHFKTKRKLSQRDVNIQIQYSRVIANHVVQYAKSDGYNQLSTYNRYTPKKEEGYWYPTPPEYMGAIEPKWETIRTFFLDSASQFAPAPAAAFSKDTSSGFYKQVLEVYNIAKNITTEQIEIANFWDCNPFAVTYSGHMAIGLKKISPGGHWMSIAGIASIKASLSFDSAVLVHTAVALTLHDAFISCWKEKYSSDRIRPESAINKLIDASWRPILQTPPFPEYTSGHSVASASVAVVLTHLLGDNFRFTDTSEKYFGLPERHFNSFREAAEEAAISRLYGGIHFRDACEEGVRQGGEIGKLVVKRLFD